MPELRDDATEDGFHEIQLSRKQLVFLLMSTSVVLILVFLLGVVVGRDTAVKGIEQPISTAGTEAPVDTGTTPIVPPEPQDDSPVTTQPPAQPLSYPTLVTGDEKKPKPAEPQPPVATPPVATPPVENPPPAAQVKPPEARTAPEPTVNVPTSGRPGAWVIQISALKSRQPAAEWVQRLRSKGYPAFLDNSAPGVFRVRVGRFKDRGEAERTARRLEKEESTKSVISR